MKINPFSPNGIVKTTLFGGRTDYILKIIQKLSYVKAGRAASFYLYGERGIGKTALAKLIKYISEKNDDHFSNLRFLTSYYSTQQNQTFKSVLEASLNNIADQMSSNLLDQMGKKLGKLFSNGKFSIGAFGVEAAYQGNQVNAGSENILIKDQFVSIARNLINGLKNQTEGEKHDGLLIIIDEMDNIVDLESAASIIRGITTTLDFEDLGYLSFLFIGYHSGLDTFVHGDISVKRLIDEIHLEEMPANEVVETFEKGFKEAGINWDKDALMQYHWQSGGYPLAIQVIGYHLIDGDKDANLADDDWLKASFASAFELREKEYSAYYSFEVKEKKNADKIMVALALANRVSSGALSLKEIASIAKVKNPRQYLAKMLKQGVVFIDAKSQGYVLKRGLLRTAIIIDYINCAGMEKFEEFVAEINKVKNNNPNGNQST